MNQKLKNKLKQSIDNWNKNGCASRMAFTNLGNELLEWKKIHKIEGLWDKPPLLITATMDDAWGHGLEIIHLYARVAGLRILPLGLLCSPETIIDQCQKHIPSILGMTMLQFDSEENMAFIRENIPKQTIIVAGGPLFRSDPELAQRAGINFVAKDAIAFMNFLLTFKPS